MNRAALGGALFAALSLLLSACVFEENSSVDAGGDPQATETEAETASKPLPTSPIVRITTQPEGSINPLKADAVSGLAAGGDPDEATSQTLRVLASEAADVDIENATPATTQPTNDGTRRTTTTRNTAHQAPPTTRPPTTKAPSTKPPTTKAPADNRWRSDYFATLGPGKELPSGDWCARHVRSAPEVRDVNKPYNSRKGSSAHDIIPRVDGNFTGTTDEILQWAACKWGIDENIVRAQAVVESWWDQSRGRDETNDQSRCHHSVRTESGPCPESNGILQVRHHYHSEAYENGNAVRSTAYNVDYAYAKWRECYEGKIEWLNTVDRGKQYKAGDMEGCLGVWYAGRWYTKEAYGYIARVKDVRDEQVWKQDNFLKYKP